MTVVYVLQHSREVDDQGNEDVKMIGVYDSEQAARAAIKRLAAQPGFRDGPDGFSVTPYEMNKDHWTEGFISWEEALKPEIGGPHR